MSKDTTVRLRLVASYYLGEARFDKTRALELAGFRAKSRRNLRDMAQEYFKNPELSRMIEEKVKTVELTQNEILKEYAELARYDWRGALDRSLTEDDRGKVDMGRVKAFDTMMRAKLKALSDMLKVSADDLKEKIEQVRAAFEEHKRTNPEMSDADREELFKEAVPPDVLRQVMAELLAADADNQQRLKEVEIEYEEEKEED